MNERMVKRKINIQKERRKAMPNLKKEKNPLRILRAAAVPLLI
jgi:hypothetical protein